MRCVLLIALCVQARSPTHRSIRARRKQFQACASCEICALLHLLLGLKLVKFVQAACSFGSHVCFATHGAQERKHKLVRDGPWA
jgi:hypothetical protein